MTPQEFLADNLDLTLDELDEMNLYSDDLNDNYGNSGEMLYEHYFYVPECTPKYILEKKGWSVGETIYVPIIPDLSEI